MAQTTIRKGFFFYFGLFVLLCIAVFLFCLVIMMFNPGHTVLWMQYFTGNSVTQVKQLTESNANINYETIQEITVNCDYANVIVQANEEYTTGKGVYIVNRAKGFTIAKGAKKFDYSISQNGSELVIDVTEPTGFLFFSKKIDVIINCYQNWTFGNLKLNVNATGAADVYFGSDGIKNDKQVTLGNVDVETEKGNIYITKNAVLNGTTTLSSNSGRIRSLVDSVVIGGETKLKTKTGRININTINVGANNIEITNTKGSVWIDNVHANTVYAVCVQGNFVFGRVDGNLDFSRSKDKIVSPSINADEITGAFILVSGNEDRHVSPEAYVKKVGGMLQVAATKGKITVLEANGSMDIESTGNFSEDITVGEYNISTIAIINKSGAIKLTFLGSVGSDVTLKNESAKTYVNFTTAAKFTAVAKKFSNNTENVAESNIDISIDGSRVDYSATLKSELHVVGSSMNSGTINIFTDNKIYYTLIAA